jgi:hypothetical protein
MGRIPKCNRSNPNREYALPKSFSGPCTIIAVFVTKRSYSGIGKDHRIPLAELKCMSPKRVKELDLYLGAGRARTIKSAHGRRPLFRPGS